MKAIYKCRLCGEKYTDLEIEYGIAYLNLSRLILDENSSMEYAFNRATIHKCKDGSLGFADFQGFKKESEENK